MAGTGIYRLRKSFFGKSILQERMSYPCLLGGEVDSSVREIVWEDVKYNKAPVILKGWIKEAVKEQND